MVRYKLDGPEKTPCLRGLKIIEEIQKSNLKTLHNVLLLFLTYNKELTSHFFFINKMRYPCTDAVFKTFL